MPDKPLGAFVRHVRRLVDDRAVAELSDGQLLERFAVGREPAALEALVERHGPLVLGVCRRVLGRRAEVDDAFQATFLVFVRKATSLDRRGSVAPWLYTVARRLALKVKAGAGRVRPAEALPEPAVTADPLRELTAREYCGALDEELGRLPEKFRAPLVLCGLEGLTRDEAAQRLGWTVNVLKGRLERGRALLRKRLARRGLEIPTVLLTAALAERASAALVASTARAAAEFLGGPTPTRATALAEGVLRTMFFTKGKVVAAALLLACVTAVGAGAVVRAALAGGASAPDQGESPAVAEGPREGEAKPPVDALGDALPAGALARFGTDRYRHTHTIRSITFSRDGKLLASASWDRTVRLWDAATGREVRRFNGHADGASGVALSPDGKLLASGDMGKTLIVWDAATGRELFRRPKLENTIFFIAFAPDGTRVAAAGGGALRVWDVATKAERVLPAPKGDVGHVRFSPDGKTVAAVCADRSVRLWDAGTGKEVQRFAGHEDVLYSFAFAADGKTLASVAGGKDGTTRVWDVADGKELRRTRGPAGWPHGNSAFDGRTLAVGNDKGEVRLWDVANGVERGTLRVSAGDGQHFPWIMGLNFAPDGKTLACTTTGRGITLWDVATLKERTVFPGHREEVRCLAFALGGRRLASGGGDGALCFWDPAHAETDRRHDLAHPGSVTDLAVTPDGGTLVSVGGGGKVRVWDAAEGREKRQWQAHKGGIDGVAVSPDGTTLATGSWQDHTVRLWDLATGKERLAIALPKPAGHNYGNVPMTFTPDGKSLISGSGDRINPVTSVWDVVTGRERCHIAESAGDPGTMALHPDGKRLAMAGGKTIRLYDVATGQRVGGVEGDDDAGTCVAYSPDGRLLAAGGGPDQPTVRLWEVATGKLVGKRQGHKGWLKYVTFSPDGRRLASGSEDTTVLVWDVDALVAGATRAVRLGACEVELLWNDLAGDDAVKARRAVVALSAAPADAVPFLRSRLLPAPRPDARRVARLVVDLDGDAFEDRERAERELEALGAAAAPALRKALESVASAEVRRRVEGLLAKADGAVLTASTLREVRAVEVLERAGTEGARVALEALANGAPGVRLTREAGAALRRAAPHGLTRAASPGKG